jgi:hypothetical protein
VLTQAIVTLAGQYGRYGYRQITALLQHAGWQVGKNRVERIWRREGLKVPKKQKHEGDYGSSLRTGSAPFKIHSPPWGRLPSSRCIRSALYEGVQTRAFVQGAPDRALRLLRRKRFRDQAPEGKGVFNHCLSDTRMGKTATLPYREGSVARRNGSQGLA